jgi:hypothetical protein
VTQNNGDNIPNFSARRPKRRQVRVFNTVPEDDIGDSDLAGDLFRHVLGVSPGNEHGNAKEYGEMNKENPTVKNERSTTVEETNAGTVRAVK